MRHGGRSERVVLPRAREILTATLENPRMPDHVRSPAFAVAVAEWAKAEAVAELVYEWAVRQIADGGMAAVMMPPMPGTKPPLETWRGLHAHAARLRARVGLDPVSYAALAKDLGIAQRAADDALERMAARGAEITARRELEAGGGTGETAA